MLKEVCRLEYVKWPGPSKNINCADGICLYGSNKIHLNGFFLFLWKNYNANNYEKCSDPLTSHNSVLRSTYSIYVSQFRLYIIIHTPVIGTLGDRLAHFDDLPLAKGRASSHAATKAHFAL